MGGFFIHLFLFVCVCFLILTPALGCVLIIASNPLADHLLNISGDL